MEAIKNQIKKVEEACEKYPLRLPTKIVAELLGMKEEGLKSALTRGNAPFGFGYQLQDGGNRVMVIPTTKFYLWFTNTNAQMVMQGD